MLRCIETASGTVTANSTAAILSVFDQFVAATTAATAVTARMLLSLLRLLPQLLLLLLILRLLLMLTAAAASWSATITNIATRAALLLVLLRLLVLLIMALLNYHDCSMRTFQSVFLYAHRCVARRSVKVATHKDGRYVQTQGNRWHRNRRQCIVLRGLHESRINGRHE